MGTKRSIKLLTERGDGFEREAYACGVEWIKLLEKNF